jgi:hypothetical protein
MEETTMRCGSNACTKVTEVDGQYVFTSTINGNDGQVTYTAAEFAQFIADVKAGEYDDMHRRAREMTAPVIA